MSGTRRLVRMLCIAIPLPVIALGVMLLSGSPSPQMLGLTLAATLCSLIVAVAVNHVVSRRLLKPLRALDHQLAHQSNVESIMLPALAHHVRERINRERAADLAELNALRDRLQTLEVPPPLSHTVGDQEQQRSQRIAAGIVDTSTALIEQLQGPLPNPRANQLAARLELLADEFGATRYADDFIVPTDIRQIVDVAVDAADACGFGTVTPLFSDAVCGQIDANPSALSALVFHMLADLAPIKGYLHVRQHPPAGIALLATSWHEVPESNRFTELLDAVSGQFEAGLLTLPVSGITRSHPGPKGRVWIAAQSDGEHRALAARLATMGYRGARSPEEADLALVTCDDDPAVTAQARHCAHVITAGVALNLAAGNVKPIAYPIIHTELAAAINSQPQGLRLLAVDDDRRALELLTNVCRADDIEVAAASKSDAALELATSMHFDAALIDLNLGQSDGIALAEAIRRSVKPTFLLTAFADDADRKRAAAAGIDAVFEKPFQPEILRSQLAGRKAPPPPSRNTTNDRFDPELALRLAHFRPDVARDMIEALIQSIPEDVSGIGRALDKGDLVQVRELTHRFNGGLQYCGVPRLREATQMLETAARHEGPDEVRLAYLVFEHEAHAVARTYDPDANVFDTSVVKDVTKD